MKIEGFRIQRQVRIIVIHVFLALVALIYIYPFLWMLGASFKDLGEFASASGLGLIPKVIKWDNYVVAWREAEFSKYFLNSVFYSVVPLITSLLLSAMAGYSLSLRNLPGRGVLIGALVVMMFLPAGYTIIPVFMLMQKLGLVGTRLGVILPSMGPNLTWVLLFMAFYSSMSSGTASLQDAATIDGASFFQTFWYIMLPLGRPMFATWGIFGFLTAWNNFLWPLVITMGNESLRPLVVGLYTFRGEHMIEWTLLMAGTTIALIPIVIVFFLAQKQIIEGMAGAIKM